MLSSKQQQQGLQTTRNFFNGGDADDDEWNGTERNGTEYQKMTSDWNDGGVYTKYQYEDHPMNNDILAIDVLAFLSGPLPTRIF